MLIVATHADLVDLLGKGDIEAGLELVDEFFLPARERAGRANTRALAAMGLSPTSGQTIGVHVKQGTRATRR